MEEVTASLKGLANREAVQAMIVSSIAMYGVLLVVPEPVTKLVAATITAALVVYLGVDTLYSLRDGWRRLVARTDAAETFDELRSAGEQFGKLMGANAARVLVMVAAAAVGSRAGDVAKVLPKLAGPGQALRFVTAEGVEVEVEAVQTATISESGVTLTRAPGEVADAVVEGEALAEGEAAAAEGAGETVLGRYPAYVEKAAELNARRFNVPTAVWKTMSPAEKWAANQKFLDRMIARGDEVILASPVKAAEPGSFFARELEYLRSKGFTLSSDGTRMLPPSQSEVAR